MKLEQGVEPKKRRKRTKESMRMVHMVDQPNTKKKFIRPFLTVAAGIRRGQNAKPGERQVREMCPRIGETMGCGSGKLSPNKVGHLWGNKTVTKTDRSDDSCVFKGWG